MALEITSWFSTSPYQRLQTGSSCSSSGNGSAISPSSLYTRSSSSSSSYSSSHSSSTGFVTACAQLRHPPSASSCFENLRSHASTSGTHLQGGARCRGERRRSEGRGRGRWSLTSDFVSSKLWRQRVGAKRRHSQQITRGGVVQVQAARMESGAIKVGFRAPDFELPEPLTGKTYKLDDFEDQQALLVMFICNHCPFVIHLKESIAKFAEEFHLKGLGIVAISANSVVTHPQDGPQYMAEEAKKFGYVFPYLYDETQEVAKSFGAVCTPDFFLFKKDGRRPFELAYHGRFDETRPSSKAPITGRDLRAAVSSILKGLPVNADQKPSIGCSIKWNPRK